MKTSKKQLAIWIASAIIVIGAASTGIYLYENQSKSAESNQVNSAAQSTNVETDSSAKVTTLTYQGQDGKTALELLESAATVEKSGEGENAYITSINGVKADSTKEYWAFSINGEASMVGAGSYVTKSSDVIKWDLTTF
jgi:hypothetical protein